MKLTPLWSHSLASLGGVSQPWRAPCLCFASSSRDERASEAERVESTVVDREKLLCVVDESLLTIDAHTGAVDDELGLHSIRDALPELSDDEIEALLRAARWRDLQLAPDASTLVVIRESARSNNGDGFGHIEAYDLRARAFAWRFPGDERARSPQGLSDERGVRRAFVRPDCEAVLALSSGVIELDAKSGEAREDVGWEDLTSALREPAQVSEDEDEDELAFEDDTLIPQYDAVADVAFVDDELWLLWPNFLFFLEIGQGAQWTRVPMQLSREPDAFAPTQMAQRARARSQPLFVEPQRGRIAALCAEPGSDTAAFEVLATLAVAPSRAVSFIALIDEDTSLWTARKEGEMLLELLLLSHRDQRTTAVQHPPIAAHARLWLSDDRALFAVAERDTVAVWRAER